MHANEICKRWNENTSFFYILNGNVCRILLEDTLYVLFFYLNIYIRSIYIYIYIVYVPCTQLTFIFTFKLKLLEKSCQIPSFSCVQTRKKCTTVY